MADPRLFRLRVRYAEQGRLAMLSHLEITHALERIVRRSGLPFALSQGFSPHMKIAFGPALPVGVGGLDEVFDIQLTAYIAPDKALSALQGASPADLAPHACAYVEPSADAASVAFPVGTYEVTLDAPLAHLSVPDEVSVMRKGKEKVLSTADYLVGAPRLEGQRLIFALRSTQAGSMRADAFADACIQLSARGSDDMPKVITFMRISLG